MTRRERELAEKEELARLYPTTPNEELALRFNTTATAIKNRASRYGFKKANTYVDKFGRSMGGRGSIGTDQTEEYLAMVKKSSLKTDRKRLREVEVYAATAKNYKEALHRIDELEQHVEAIKRLKASNSSHIIKASTARGADEATAVACLSDVHVGAEVRPEQVQGLNAYNLDISRKRVDQFFAKIVRLADKERQDVNIDELILFLGGDIIDGALHMDTIMSNEQSEPIKQAVLAQSWIRSGLLHLEPHFKRITIVCKDGNHGRVTHKIHHSSRQGNSLEWYMFYMLAQELPQFNWIVDEGLHTLVTLYRGHPGARVLRFHHGDTISFGGVNGPYTYLNRRRFQWNSQNVTEGIPIIDVMGHLHMYRATMHWVLNGSVVGYNPFAVSLGAEYEKPQQAFFLVDRKRGLTVNIPILFSV